MPAPLRRTALPALAAAVLLGATACSTGPTGSGAGSGATATAAATATGGASSGPDTGAFPVTLTHAWGSTTITAAPTRIATVGWSDADFVVALGQLPVGATKITWGGNAKASTDWFDAGVAKLDANASITRYDDSAGIPIDEIAALKPDLILGVNSGVKKEEYDKLTKIAPTVAYPGAAWGTSWQDSLDLVGKALGRSARAAELKTATEQVIATGTAKYPQIKGKSAAWTWFTLTDLSTVGLYTSNDLRPQMLREFGLVDAPVVTKLSSGTNQFSANLSAEKASTLDADMIVFYAEPTTLAKVKGNRLLAQIPALKAGRYIANVDNAVSLSMSLPSPLAMPVAVETYLPKIASALDGTPAE